jgi:hypothetical protein
MSLTLFPMDDKSVWNRSCQWINNTADPGLKSLIGTITRLSLSAALAIILTSDIFEAGLTAARAGDGEAVKIAVSRLVEIESFANGVDLVDYPEEDVKKLERILVWLIDCSVNA